MGIGLKKAADGRIVIRHEGQAAAHHVGIVVDQTHHNREKGIRIVQVPHNVPLVLCQGNLREFQHMLDIVGHGAQDHLAPEVHLLRHHTTEPLILNHGDDLHQHGGEDHNSHAGYPSGIQFFHAFFLSNCKVIICFRQLKTIKIENYI